MHSHNLLKPLAAALLLLASGAACSQAPLTLKEAFAAAWARQPEARAEAGRRAAAAAGLDAAGSWSAAPPVAEVTGRSDRFNRDQGTREYELGVALPLWLPGERAGARALAGAELAAVDGRAAGARWRLAGLVRDAYWAWLRAGIERDSARVRQANAEQLAADVARRLRAGDLSRADSHQAEGAAASAAVAVAEAESALALAAQQLRALLGRSLPAAGADTAEALPADLHVAAAGHPALHELAAAAEVARRDGELARIRTRANPELIVATTRDRIAPETEFAQTVTLGMRIPFGSDSRQRERIAAAGADLAEAEARLAGEGERLQAEAESARARVAASRAQVAAAERRAALARETRSFFDKSFRLGESDLPTRLRVELEAFEAERQAARARIDAAQAVSALRQALGLLPE